MRNILIILAIWVVIAFIYGKVTKTKFLVSFISIPLKIVSFLLKDHGSNQKIRAKAKRQGRDDVIEKLDMSEAVTESAACHLDNAVDRMKDFTN